MTQTLYMKRSVFLVGLLVLFLGAVALVFHEIVGSYLQNLTPPPLNSVRGEWVGVVDMPTIRNPWVQPDGRRAVIRFTLKREPDFVSKYGGFGELTIEGKPAQPIEVTHLWLPDDPSIRKPQAYEAGLWKRPYDEKDNADFLSGGYEGTFSPGTLVVRRQTDLGYDISGTLHKGTDEEYASLVRQLNQRPPRPEPPPAKEPALFGGWKRP